MTGEAAPPYRALGRLICCIGAQGFGRAAFELVRTVVQADHIVAHVVDQHHVRGLFTEGLLSARIAATINQRYLERYHMLDKSVLLFRELGEQEPVVTRFDQRLNESSTYHAYFFERTGLRDKLSVVSNRGQGMVFCNLYRLAGSDGFSQDDSRNAQALAPALMAAIWQHVDKAGRPSLPAMKMSVETDARQRQALMRLSGREMQVCQRLLAGASNEGVALDLEISLHTVRTVRKRIYKKLQVNSLSDLFAKYMNAMSAMVSGGR